MTPTTSLNTNAYSRPALSDMYTASLSEHTLLERCQSGDSVAWNTLFHRYAKPLYNYAYLLCRNHEDANDIVGHAFLRLYQHLGGYRKDASFRKWVFTIVRNIFLDQYVRPAHRRNLSLDAGLTSNEEACAVDILPSPAPSPEALCIEHEAARILARAIRNLPAYQCQTFRMYYADGRTYDEIAKRTNVSIGTVKSRLHRARAVLRTRLMPYRDALIVA